MRRLFIDAKYLTVALLAASCSATAEGSSVWSDPPEISAADAASYAGREVRVVGTVGAAEAREGRAVLVLDDGGGAALHVVIAPPLIGPKPVELAERFRGREIEARGTIDDLGGRVELLVGDPERVRVVDAAAVAPVARDEARTTSVARDETARSPSPASADPTIAASHTAPAAVAAAPREAVPSAREVAAAPREVPPVPRDPSPPPAAAPARETAAADDAAAACERARAAWREAAEAARAPLLRLERCLASARPPCRGQAASLREALAELAAAEERFAWLCAGAPAPPTS
jgi:hypothetical protein